MFLTWNLTVPSETTRVRAISALVSPLTRCSRTSISRGVSRSRSAERAAGGRSPSSPSATWRSCARSIAPSDSSAVRASAQLAIRRSSWRSMRGRLALAGRDDRGSPAAQELGLDQRVADLRRRGAQLRERVLGGPLVAGPVQRLGDQPALLQAAQEHAVELMGGDEVLDAALQRVVDACAKVAGGGDTHRACRISSR